MPSQQPSTTSEDIPRPAITRKLIVISAVCLGVALLLVAGTVTWRSLTSTASSETPPETGVQPAPPGETPSPTTMPTVLPQQVAATNVPVTPTASLTPLPAAEPESVLPLPTVTPTPPMLPVSPRNVEVSGETTMRLALSGAGFDSTGRPLRLAIASRTHVVGGETPTAEDEWCIQLGLVNELFDLNMQLDPATEELAVTGNISLREGLCEAPGAVMDTVEIDLSVPTGAAAQISYNLRGRRSLFGMTGLLDSDTGAIVELRITNSRP
jgi:hypothetical protein